VGLGSVFFCNLYVNSYERTYMDFDGLTWTFVLGLGEMNFFGFRMGNVSGLLCLGFLFLAG